MIQSVMLAALGFIAASLLALLIAPAFWARAVRLTNQRLRGALPISEQEIRADKDLLRAEYALKVHQLEREVEQGRLAAHRQQIEINRRDIEIRRLAESLGVTQTSLSEHSNARSVLEQTVTERIPLLERSLAEARGVLQARNTALDDLQATADRQAAALEDGRAILTQRALEVQRLQALFQEASAQGRGRADAGSDAMALRADIESLKARLAERAAVIDRLQGEVAARPKNAALVQPNSLPADASADQLRALIAEQAGEITQLRRNLETRPHTTIPSMLPPAERDLAAQHLQGLETQLRSQADELARLRAENEAISRADDPAANARVRDSKVWLRARIERIEGDLDAERDTAGRLRAELAAANERFARQGLKFRDEIKRQGSRIMVPARQILRDSEKAPDSAAAQEHYSQDAEPVSRRAAVSTRARELQRVLQGHFGEAGPKQSALAADPAARERGDAATLPGIGADAAVAAQDVAADPASEPASRGRLLDRLKSYEQA